MNQIAKWFSLLVLVAAVLVKGFYQFVSTPAETVSEPDLGKGQKLIQDFNEMADKSVYDFKYTDIDGVEQSMEKYRGHVLIVVNVASKCGFTCVNYQQLTELYTKYESEGLRILAFPCNQFMSQEPLGENEIKEFAKEYNVTYDMASKINVNGDDAVPLWTFLKEQQKGILGTTLVKWNFTKFLVDRKGNVLKRYAPNTPPKEMEKDIQEALKAQ